MPSNKRVLVIDDQVEIHEDFREMLAPSRPPTMADKFAAAFVHEDQEEVLPTFELLHAHSGDEAITLVEESLRFGKPIAMAFVDIRMPPGMNGVTTVRRIRDTDPDIEFVIMTAYTDLSLPDLVANITPLHKLLYVRKPFTREEIQQMAIALVEKYNVAQQLKAHERELQASHHRLEAILESSGEAIAMIGLDDRIAFANQRFEELCSAKRNELVGQPAGDCQPPVRTLTPSDAEHTAFFGGEEEVLAWAGADRRGPFHRAETRVTDARGEAIGRLHIYRDLSTQVDNRRMDAELRQLRSELESSHSFSGILGSSRAMLQMFALMRRAAESDLPVLIRGESGTGKELVAKALHYNGPRKEKRLEVVNCAALPEGLFESELFGHERGAFTGAGRRHLGAFERANGGTVFLDEIAELKPDQQAKLLRVLQEREVQRVGGEVRIPIDVQIIAATNRDLVEMMHTDAFRQDLYWRIAVYPIIIPPLRERLDDIPELAALFLDKAMQRSGREIVGFTEEAMRRLLKHDWPGNVRELESVISRAALVAPSEKLTGEDLLPVETGTISSTRDGQVSDRVAPLAEVERRAVAHALEVFGQNVTRAARALGVDRTTLYRKMKEMNQASPRESGHSPESRRPRESAAVPPIAASRQPSPENNT